MSDIFLQLIEDTQANHESNLAAKKIGLATDTWSLVANIGGNRYRYRPTEKDGVALSITFGAVSCASMTTSGVLTGNSLVVTNGGTFGSSVNVTGNLTTTVGITTNTLTSTTAMRTNSLVAYTGGVVTCGSGLTLDTGYDLTMSATGTIKTDTIDDVSGGGVTANAKIDIQDYLNVKRDLTLNGDGATSFVSDIKMNDNIRRARLIGGSSTSSARVIVEGIDFDGTMSGTANAGGDLILGSGTNSNAVIKLQTGSFDTIMELGSSKLSFFGSTLATQQDITGSTGGNAALQDLLSKLATIGLITDSTT